MVRPLVTSMDFVCQGSKKNACGMKQTIHFQDGKFAQPEACVEKNCRSFNFQPDRTSARTVDFQQLRIQELADDAAEAGRIPRTVECEIREDLVDCCIPGDVLTVSGVIKSRSISAGMPGNSGKGKCLFLLFLDVNSVSNSKSSENGKLDLLQFTMKDMQMVQQLANLDNPFRAIVNSIAPAIYGNELVKAGFALTLFGGVRKNAEDKNRIPVRGDPHMLVVGDPGLGKSQMLQAVSTLAPRGVYVCGNTTTTTGLTVTMVRDAGSGDFALEAGALVLADQGVCCIDEFDKMGTEHQALLETMEQQSISIAKGGIVCNLSARTSVVAAANPVGGHYSRSKTVSENLKMSAAMLSRFDLIFILLDKPDADRDALLSEHVMSLHARGKGPSRPGSSRPGTGMSSRTGTAGREEWEKHKPLEDRLKHSPDERVNFDVIPAPMLRKYVAYARKYCAPRLSDGACKVLQGFYLELRKNHQSVDSTPITTRQLESMIRLAEARARMELRETVTAQDALDVVELMKVSLLDVFADEAGNLDFSRAQAGMSGAKTVKQFVAAMTRRAQDKGSKLFNFEELRQVGMAARIGNDAGAIRDILSKCNEAGYLLKKSGNLWESTA